MEAYFQIKSRGEQKKRVGRYESLEGPLLKKENIFYLVITRKLTRNNEITNSL